MNLRPVGSRVIIKREEPEGKSKGGIILPDAAKEKPQRGKVIAVGLGKSLDSGQREECPVCEGDVVLFSRYSENKIEVGEEDLVSVGFDDIIAVLS